MGTPVMPTRPTNPLMAGANGLQAALDRVARTLERTMLSPRGMSTIQSVANGGRIQFAPGGNPGWAGNPNGGWTTSGNRLHYQPNLGGNRPNGGGGTFPTTTMGGAPVGGAGGGGGGGGAPPVGGAPVGGAPPTSTGMSVGIGRGMNGAWDNLVTYGNDQRGRQTAMDTYASYAASRGNALLNGGLRKQFLGDAFGAPGQTPNSIALNATDALTANIIRMRQFGSYGGANYKMSGTNMASINLASQGTLGAAGSMGLQQQLYTPQTFWRLQQMGMGATYGAGGKRASVNTIAQGFLNRTFGGKPVSAANLAESFSMGGNAAYNLQQLGLDSSAQQAFQDVSTQLNNAKLRGYTASDLDKWGEQATGANYSKGQRSEARKQLERAGVNVNTMLDAEKRLQGTKDERDAEINKEYADSMKTAANSVERFNLAMNKLLDWGPFKWLLGQSGGSSVLNSAVSDTKGLLKMMGPLGWVAAGGVSLGGGAMSAASGIMGGAEQGGGGKQANQGGDGQTLAPGVNVGRFLAEARKQTGKPYVMGDEGPNTFDCSGFVTWALNKAGYKTGSNHLVVDGLDKLPGKNVPVNQARPGDLLVRNGAGASGHVAIYAGNGKTLEARGRAYGTGSWPAFQGRSFTHARRIIGTMGDISGDTPGNSTPGNQVNTDQNSKLSAQAAGAFSSGDYGSTSELEAVMAALSGGTGGGPIGSTQSSNTNNSQGNNTDQGTNGDNIPPSGAISGKNDASKAAAKKYAKGLLGSYGWSGKWDSLLTLWQHESGWRWWADNPSSDAYGIPQALPGSKMGAGWKTDAAAQVRWGMKYIKSRYGDPDKAWNFWQKNHWYDKGAWEIEQDENARIHKGEMVIPAKQAGIIRDALLKDALIGTPTNGSSSRGRSSGGAPSLTFNAGSIVIQVNGSLDDATARSAARALAAELSREDVYSKIAAGVTVNA